MTNMLWHILTSEYPPDAGGVADYTARVAQGLASRGHEVHVWCAGRSKSDTVLENCDTAERSRSVSETENSLRRENEPVRDGGNAIFCAARYPEIHRMGLGFGVDFRTKLTAGFSRYSSPQRLLVQYTPHGFGWKAMNLPLCWWLLQRKRKHGDDIWVMFHEVAYPIVIRPLKHLPLGLVNRAMAALVLRAASRVFMSIPGWEPVLRNLARRGQKFEWLPVPSNLTHAVQRERVEQYRASVVGGKPVARQIVGHFGTYSESITSLLTPVVCQLLGQQAGIHVLLLGRNSDTFVQKLLTQFPQHKDRVSSTGFQPSDLAAESIAACDLMLQPFPDGVSTRRTSIMACMALGVPIVSTIGHLTEPWWTANNALPLSSVGNAREMVDNAMVLLGDDRRRCELAARVRNLYRDQFSLGKLLDRLEN